MQIQLTLALPRDELSIPVVRRILTSSMNVLGVQAECTAEVAVAVSEACTNVLEHAPGSVAYQVSVVIDDDRCVIEVVDVGAGFDAADLGNTTADVSAEEGRGIYLMREMVDRVGFASRPEHGTVVHLEKKLHWYEGSPIERLAANEEPRLTATLPAQSAADPLR